MTKCIPCWTLNYPRPCGVEPTIYLYKPSVDNAEETPFTPEVIQHVTILGAIKYITDFNWDCAYLKEIKIKEKE